VGYTRFFAQKAQGRLIGSNFCYQLFIFPMEFRPAWYETTQATLAPGMPLERHRGSILEEYFWSTCASENIFSEGTE
jgi:hypothetical protein